MDLLTLVQKIHFNLRFQLIQVPLLTKYQSLYLDPELLRSKILTPLPLSLTLAGVKRVGYNLQTSEIPEQAQSYKLALH